jgi:hypothetical protein
MSQDDLPPPARRGGALAFKSEHGDWIVAEPHDVMYSTVTIGATHFWRNGRWQTIHDTDCGNDAETVAEKAKEKPLESTA